MYLRNAAFWRRVEKSAAVVEENQLRQFFRRELEQARRYPVGSDERVTCLSWARVAWNQIRTRASR